MIAQHTITHAIQYLRNAIAVQRQSSFPASDAEYLAMVDPERPCAAYGLAKRTLRRCGSLAGAIADLESQLEQS
jgi:hypothetical protein